MEYRWDDARASRLGDDLDRMVYVSNLIGADPLLVQTGGGNTSLKLRDDSTELLWVKASGTDLKTLARPGFAGLRLESLRLLGEHEEMSDEELMAFLRTGMLDPRGAAPSVETPLHSILPARCIAHTHDLATQALTDTSKKDGLVREALKDEVAIVGYIRPGYPLASAVLGLGDLGNRRGLVLGKHGLVAWGDSPKECYDNLHWIITRAEEFIRTARGSKAPLSRARHRAGGRPETRAILPRLRGLLSRHRRMVLHLDDSEEALRFADSQLARKVHRRGMATPEHILRCGRVPLYVDADFRSLPADGIGETLTRAVDAYEAEARASFKKHGIAGEMMPPSPRVAILPGVGIVAAGKDAKNARIGSECYRHVTRVIEVAEAIDQFRFLDDASAFEFEYWPLELAKLRQPEKELSRRVAVVTGAASGIGRAVAERFAAEGAHVVLADLDGKGAEEAARAIGAPDRTLAVAADATDERATEEMFDRAVRAFGGVDILVCNAGFVKTGPIEETPLDVWRKHLDVNLDGTFLAVRAAVRVMKAQGIGGSIVLNASKAAFSPPAGNAPYAASKAAVAHLARSLAVELAPHAIRVNYFNADFIDTPLMRTMIRERAAAKGIQEEAQQEEYRKRNLLGVGPIPPAAVAEAALFLASDRSRYTTGAVLTVDGGLRDAFPR